ncbi:isoprenylcysteine carboxylmethyltransferase family protein [Catellatospora sp. NPDC049609]|uniref:methyltransferase family protein n=1 Tax=Catellatospora sp. NPDC049609 TaxID=3155505 RepID=UPI00343C0FCD
MPAQGLLTAAGWVLIVVGVATLLHSFLRFIVEGLGTPAPVAETEHLVVGGLYRFVRNPMYVAVDMAILGQAAVLRSTSLLVYWVVVSLGQAAFVHFYEEPRLRARYGESYDEYRRAVPAWFPRLRRREPSPAEENAG